MKRTGERGERTPLVCEDVSEHGVDSSKGRSSFAAARDSCQALHKKVSKCFYNPFSSDNPENGGGATIVLLINTMIGSGILNQPYVFSQAGIGATLIIYAITAYATWLGLVLLIRAGTKAKSMDLSDLAGYCFGDVGDKLTDIFVAVGNFGALLSYLTVIGGEASEMLGEIGDLSGSDMVKEFGKIQIILPIIVVLFSLPLCLTRLYGHFVMISTISIFSITCVMGLVLFYGPIAGSNYQDEPVVWFNFLGAVEELGSTVFAFACSYAVFHAYNSMDPGSQKGFDKLAGVTVMIGAFMCLVTGLAGYLCFRSHTEGDILDNFTGPAFYFFRLLLIVHLLLYIPLDFVVMRYSFLKLFKLDAADLHWFPYTLVTVALLFVTTFVVVVLYDEGLSEGDAFDYILDFFGGLTGSYLGYILPAISFLYLAKNAEDPWTLFQAKVLLVWGVLVILFVPAYSLYNLIESIL